MKEESLELNLRTRMMMSMESGKKWLVWMGKQSTSWRLFGISLAIHALLVFVIHHYRDARLWENGAIADMAWAGKGFAAGFSIPDELTSWQAPGYPWLLLGAWDIFGFRSPHAHLAISLLQVAVMATLVFPVTGLTRRWFGDPAACIGGWMAVLMPLWLWYPTRLHHSALVMAFQPWLLWAWLQLAGRGVRDRKRVWLAIGAGVGTGVAGLFQPVMLGIFGLISGALFFRSLFQRPWSISVAVLGAGLLTLLILAPWTWRNYEVHGRWMLVKDSFGKEFWMGNNPHATGTGYAEGGMEEITNKYPPKSFELRGKVSEIELMEALQKEAWAYVKAEPAVFFLNTGKKIFWFWTLTPAKYERSSGDAEAHVFRWVQAGYWFSLVFLAAIALFRPGWPREYLCLVLAYLVLYSLVYGLTHVGQARFRGEIEFIFLPSAAGSLAWMGAAAGWFQTRKDE